MSLNNTNQPTNLSCYYVVCPGSVVVLGHIYSSSLLQDIVLLVQWSCSLQSMSKGDNYLAVEDK